MRIPPRVEVLSWNENQVADLVREHKLLDCVDCVYQRHIDGQKLLNLKEGDVLYFLEIHDEKSRAKLWSLIKRIAEKKSGVQDLMGKFQQSNGRKVSEEEQAEEWSSDEFSGSGSDFGSESDNYDVPDPEVIHPENHGKKISVDRQETIRRNLEKLMTAKRSPSPEDLEDYPDNEELYDVPEDGCGEPEQDVYETPSDESGGGVVTRKGHSTVCRQPSEQYIVPNQQAENTSDDEQQYEDLSGTPAFEQEDYVVPDMNPAAVPPRPPKPGDVKQPPARPVTPDSADEYIEPDDNGMENYEPPPLSRVTKKPEQKKSVVEQLQENYEPPRPPSKTTKSPVVPRQKKVEPQRSPFKNKKPEVIPQENYEPPRPPSKIQKSPVVQQKNVEPQRSPFKNKKREVIPQENYEPPRPPSKNKKPEVIPQENYEAPRPPSKNKKPEVIPQENYEPPRPPSKNKKPEVIPQENYEPPRPPSKNKKPEVIPQENYEPPRPPSKTKKSPVVQQKNVEPQRLPFKNKKPEVIPQENYEPPRPPPKTKKSPVVQQKNVEPQRSPFKNKKPEVIPQENYEPPRPPSKIKPVALEQENYEPPQPPSKHKPFFQGMKKAFIPESKKPKPLVPENKKKIFQESKKTITDEDLEQENYEPPPQPLRIIDAQKTSQCENKISVVKQQEGLKSSQPPPNPKTLDIEEPEEEYEAVETSLWHGNGNHDDHSANGDEDMVEQENYEIPVTEPEPPMKPSSRHMSFNPKNIFNKRNSGKKINLKQPAKPAPPQKSTIRNVPQKPDNGRSAQDRQLPPKPSSSPKVLPPSRVESKTAQNRQSMALPALPARKELPPRRETLDHVDSKTSKPAVVNERPLPPRKSPRLSREELTLPITPSAALRPAGPGASPRLPPRVSPSKPPFKSKDQLLHEQPWFHGSVKKEVYSDMLRNAKKDGAFLVRNSSRDPTKYITSIYFKSNIIHLNMPCDQGMYKLGDSGNVKFSSITELIEHFRKNHVEFATGGSTPLRHACNR